MVFDKITILIPTHNRHQYLRRILDYYSDSGMKILVADSSKDQFPQEYLYEKVEYHHYPDMEYSKKMSTVMKLLSTKYTVVCPDDDFVVKSGIKRCMEFLDAHPDYASVQGHYVSFMNKNKKVIYGPSNMYTMGMDINQDAPGDRLKPFLVSYMDVIYSVQRTESLKEAFYYTEDKIKDYNLLELCTALVIIMNGKHRILPLFYGVKESIATSSGNYTIPLYKQAKMKQFKKQYCNFFEITTKHLAKKSGIGARAARKKVSEAVSAYINELNRADNRIRMKCITMVSKLSPKATNIIKNMYFELKRIKYTRNTKQVPGYPFYDKEAAEDLKEIDKIVKKHNIPSKWKAIMI